MELSVHAALYLASGEAEFVHGTVIDADFERVGVAVTAGISEQSDTRMWTGDPVRSR